MIQSKSTKSFTIIKKITRTEITETFWALPLSLLVYARHSQSKWKGLSEINQFN